MALNTNEFDILLEIKGDIGEIKGDINGINTRSDDILIGCAICKKKIEKLQAHRTAVLTLASAAVLMAGWAIMIVY